MIMSCSERAKPNNKSKPLLIIHTRIINKHINHQHILHPYINRPTKSFHSRIKTDTTQCAIPINPKHSRGGDATTAPATSAHLDLASRKPLKTLIPSLNWSKLRYAVIYNTCIGMEPGDRYTVSDQLTDGVIWTSWHTAWLGPVDRSNVCDQFTEALFVTRWQRHCLEPVSGQIRCLRPVDNYKVWDQLTDALLGLVDIGFVWDQSTYAWFG